MTQTSSPTVETTRLVIDKYWEVFPSTWHTLHAHIHNEALENTPITVGQFHILRRIRSGKDSVSMLAEAGHISRPAISRTVDTLVNTGLIQRTRNQHDRRQVKLTLTPEGKGMLETIFGNTHQWMAERLTVLDNSELESIIQAMEALKKAFG